jgi:hypothetical protein
MASEDDEDRVCTKGVELPQLTLSLRFVDHSAISVSRPPSCPDTWVLYGKHGVRLANSTLCTYGSRHPDWEPKWTYGIGELENAISCALGEPSVFSNWFSPDKFQPGAIFPRI